MAVVLLGGLVALAGLGVARYCTLPGFRPRGPVPEAGWWTDPTQAGRSPTPRQRLWDGRSWTRRVRPAPGPATGPATGSATESATGPAPAAHAFEGRFWGHWAWWPLVTAVLLLAGGTAYVQHPEPALLAVLSGVTTLTSGLGFLLFVDRQLLWREVIGPGSVLAVAVATGGVCLAVPLWLNQVSLELFGTTGVLLTVGPIEEFSKLLVPAAIWALGRYRDPRAGLALGLGSGVGFAITEGALYGFLVPRGTAFNVCTGQALPAPGPATSLVVQSFRLLAVAPLHWLLAGLAGVVLWRLWHRAGRGRRPGTALVLLAVAAGHSLYDSGARGACGLPVPARGLQLLVVGLVLFLLYLAFKAAARRSLPPALVGRVSRGWHPRRLPTDPEGGPGDRAPASAEALEGGLASPP